MGSRQGRLRVPPCSSVVQIGVLVVVAVMLSVPVPVVQVVKMIVVGDGAVAAPVAVDVVVPGGIMRPMLAVDQSGPLPATSSIGTAEPGVSGFPRRSARQRSTVPTTTMPGPVRVNATCPRSRCAAGPHGRDGDPVQPGCEVTPGQSRRACCAVPPGRPRRRRGHRPAGRWSGRVTGTARGLPSGSGRCPHRSE